MRSSKVFLIASDNSRQVRVGFDHEGSVLSGTTRQKILLYLRPVNIYFIMFKFLFLFMQQSHLTITIRKIKPGDRRMDSSVIVTVPYCMPIRNPNKFSYPRDLKRRSRSQPKTTYL